MNNIGSSEFSNVELWKVRISEIRKKVRNFGNVQYRNFWIPETRDFSIQESSRFWNAWMSKFQEVQKSRTEESRNVRDFRIPEYRNFGTLECRNFLNFIRISEFGNSVKFGFSKKKKKISDFQNSVRMEGKSGFRNVITSLMKSKRLSQLSR